MGGCVGRSDEPAEAFGLPFDYKNNGAQYFRRIHASQSAPDSARHSEQEPSGGGRGSRDGGAAQGA